MNPRKRLVSLATAISLGLVIAGAGAAPASLCGFEEIAVFAFNSVQLSRDTTTAGDVVANSESPGPVLEEGAEVALDRGAKVTGNVSGHTLDLDMQAEIIGNANYVEIVNQGTITGSQTIAAPPYTGVPAFQVANPGGSDVFAGPLDTIILGDEGFCSVTTTQACTNDSQCPATETCQLAPVTSYNNITLGGGKVVFSGGRAFDVASISGLGTLEFDAPTDLRVAGRVNLAATSSVLTSGGAAASDVVIYVGGTNGGTGGPLSTPHAVNIGQRSTVNANIYAPNGTIFVERNSNVTGALIGRDVKVDRGSTVVEASAFANEPPTAVAQEVQTDGTNALVITLEGSDPEGGDLSFTDPVPAPPTEGTLSTISPIVPAPVQQCSQSATSCTLDTDCPGFAEGETCETVQPPITQATVTYTPFVADTPDFFTYEVKDECGAAGSAIVGINGGTNEDPGDPGPGVDDVIANDLELEAVVSQVRTITLSGGATPNAGGPPVSVTFRVVTLPAGTLSDSNGSPITTAGTDLPTPVLSYQAPATAGADSFQYSVRESLSPSSPCGAPSCDTATVNITVANAPELAPDQSVGTDLNTPLNITLFANPGGVPGGGLGPQSAGALSVKMSYGDNGPPMTSQQWSRLAARSRSPARPGRTDRTDRTARAAPAQLAPTAVSVDGGWVQFGWCDSVTSPDCSSGPLANLVNETEVFESPFEFSVTQASCLRVTDALSKGDHWRVEAQVGGNSDWTDFTSQVPQSTVGTTGDPDVAFGDSTYSHGAFDLVAGSYSVRLITIPPDSFSWGTAGYIRVDTGPCLDVVWEITSLPTTGTAPGTLTNLNGSAVNIGTQYFSLPTLVYTPNFNVSGSTSFTYKVTQGGIFGGGVVDTAQVAIDVFFDQCPFNGRPIGCAPSGGGSGPESQGATQQALEREVARGPNKGLTVAIDGAGGSVATSPVPLSRGRLLAGLICAGGSCNKLLPEGAEIILYARPDGEHFEFLGWGGDCRGDEPMITMRLSEHTSCVASFGERDPE